MPFISFIEWWYLHLFVPFNQCEVKKPFWGMADTMLQHCKVVNLCVLTIEIERMLFTEVHILGHAAFTRQSPPTWWAWHQSRRVTRTYHVRHTSKRLMLKVLQESKNLLLLGMKLKTWSQILLTSYNWGKHCIRVWIIYSFYMKAKYFNCFNPIWM